MMAANIAPGMNREFTAESWTNIIPRKLWYEAVQEAEDMIDKDVQVDIQGYDIDLMWWLQPGKCQESRSGAHDSFPAEGCG